MQTIANIFWNRGQSRLRAGWRLLIYFIFLIMITLGRDAFASAFGSRILPKTFAFLLFLAGGLALTWLMSRFIDRRSFADLGFHLNRKWWLDTGFGLALGAFLMTGVFLSMRAAGWVTITGYASTSSDLPFSLAFLLKAVALTAVAIIEEMAFRGYQMKNLAEGFAGERFGARGAILLALLFSSALFGLIHLANDNATAYSALAVILAGLLIALPYLLTGELATSIGLHLTWNLFVGPVFGFAVSGNPQTTHLFSIQQTGPSFWTGGSFGPEAGLIGLAWSFIGCGLTILWVKWLRKRVALYTPLAIYKPRRDRADKFVKKPVIN